MAFFKYNAISNVHVMILVSKFDFDDFNWPVSSVAKRMLLVQEVWGSILESVKSVSFTNGSPPLRRFFEAV